MCNGYDIPFCTASCPSTPRGIQRGGAYIIDETLFYPPLIYRKKDKRTRCKRGYSSRYTSPHPKAHEVVLGRVLDRVLDRVQRARVGYPATSPARRNPCVYPPALHNQDTSDGLTPFDSRPDCSLWHGYTVSIHGDSRLFTVS